MRVTLLDATMVVASAFVLVLVALSAHHRETDRHGYEEGSGGRSGHHDGDGDRDSEGRAAAEGAGSEARPPDVDSAATGLLRQLR